jgi:hypothetical protein
MLSVFYYAWNYHVCSLICVVCSGIGCIGDLKVLLSVPHVVVDCHM